jgi:hypothetical protein
LPLGASSALKESVFDRRSAAKVARHAFKNAWVDCRWLALGASCLEHLDDPIQRDLRKASTESITRLVNGALDSVRRQPQQDCFGVLLVNVRNSHGIRVAGAKTYEEQQDRILCFVESDSLEGRKLLPSNFHALKTQGCDASLRKELATFVSMWEGHSVSHRSLKFLLRRAIASSRPPQAGLHEIRSLSDKDA